MFFLKKVFNLTILGLTLGVFLAVSAVFAYTSPTQAPPGGNAPAPLSTGSSDQTKTGGTLNVFGLWVNQALGVSGGATIGGGLSVSGSLTSSGQSVCLANGTNCPPPPSGVPSGFVGFFNLSSCPSGWAELTSAQGRYVVGKPSGGTLAGTSGTALSDLESRPTGQHSHGITDPGHWHYLNDIAGFQGPTLLTLPDKYFNVFRRREVTDIATTGITINSTGIFGTNAPYLQLLVCQKS